MIAMICFAYADTTIVNTRGLTILPNDVYSLTLYDGVADTIEDSTLVTFGPYKLAVSKYEGMFAGYQFYSGALGGTTPTAAIAYQLTFSSDTADIISANWVTTDTLGATGATDYVDLSSKAAKYIYFRVHNYDATPDVMGKLEILFKKP